MARHEYNTLVDTLFDRGLDLRNRRVFLHSDLEGREKAGDSAVVQVTRALLFLDKTDNEIELWINSPGGEMAEMFGIYDIIRGLKNKITTIGFGEICSAACLLLACGDKRKVTKNSWFMSHTGNIDMELFFLLLNKE